MKPALICLAFILLVGLIGCHREHDKIADAATESASSVAGGRTFPHPALLSGSLMTGS